MKSKKENRLRRSRRTRARIAKQEKHRLCVFRTPRHIYAQIIGPAGDTVLASASTVGRELRDSITNTGNSDAAVVVGKTIANRALAIGVTAVAFDRSGFAFHGRVEALANAAREGGLKF